MLNLDEALTITTEELKNRLWCMPGAVTGRDYALIPGTPGSPFMLVCHIDTCHRPKIQLRQTGNVLSNVYGLLGADDRAGVYAALTIHAQAKIKPHILFTDLEECGGIGAKEAAKHLHCPPGVKLLIELDRQGCNEFVTYQDQSKQVLDYVKSFGFIESYGSYSDIADIAPIWDIASVNLSVGYYNQHSEYETLHQDELGLTISRVLAMTERPISKAYKPLRRPKYSGYCWPKSDKKGGKVCEFCNDPTIEAVLKYQGSNVCSECFDWLGIQERS
jgi:hypothetical protein